MKILTLCLLLWCAAVQAETYTEFYVIKSDPTNNLNSGHTTDLAPNFVYGGGTWTNTSCTFTVASGNPLTDTTNGAWASIYTTAGATIATCVGIISNRTATTITLDTNTVPSTAALPSTAVGATTCKVGGCWAGPNTNQNPSVTFPWAFMAGTMTNSPLHPPRFNVNTALYSYTNTVSLANAGGYPLRISAYTTTPGDGGRGTNDGSYAGNGFILLTVSGQNVMVDGMTFQHNGTLSSAQMVSVSGAGSLWHNCAFLYSLRRGINVTVPGIFSSCLAAFNNKSGTSDDGGFEFSGAGDIAIDCTSLYNTNGTTSTPGFSCAGTYLEHCISAYNGGEGFQFLGGVVCPSVLHNSDSFSNRLAAVNYKGLGSASSSPVLYSVNNNFLLSGGAGVTNGANVGLVGLFHNNGVGSGTQTNAIGNIAGNFSANGVSTNATLTYASGTVPWQDPTNINFSIVLSAAKSAGYAPFLPSTTVAYPDIGAAQASDTNSAASGGAYTFAQ